MSKLKHFIDETAHVYCPMRGRDVDLEVCLGCRRLEDFDLDTRRPYLVCRSPEFGERNPDLRPEATREDGRRAAFGDRAAS
jgi:hypothetical protein